MEEREDSFIYLKSKSCRSPERLNLEAHHFSGAPKGGRRYRKRVMEIHSDCLYTKVLGSKFKEAGSPDGV